MRIFPFSLIVIEEDSKAGVETYDVIYFAFNKQLTIVLHALRPRFMSIILALTIAYLNFLHICYF